MRAGRANCEAGASGFRDFPGLPVTKENRTGSHRTLPLTSPSIQLPALERKSMPGPSKDLKEAEGALRLVIEALIDGQEGFQGIGDSLKDETLKRYFVAESLKRAQFRGDLETILHQDGVKDIKESGTAAG